MEDRIEVSLNDVDNISEYRNYEKQRQENEENRILNEIERNNYYNSIKEKFDNGELKYEDGKDGLSAYEIALKNGFVGTEEEWLTSLRGEQGISGIVGFEVRDGFLIAISESAENINKFKIKDGNMIVTI